MGPRVPPGGGAAAGGREVAPRVVPVAALLAACPACRPDLDLPATPRIECGDGHPCPTGLACNEVVHRCLPEVGGDDRPPGLADGSVRVSPLHASLDSRLEVSLTATEPLAFPPDVVLALPAAPRLRLEAQDDPSYGLSYRPTGAEPEGVPVPVTATLVDASGNVARDLGLGAVTFDFRPPGVSSVRSPAPARAGRGSRVEVVVTVDEPLSAAPRAVVTETGAALEPDPSSEPPTVRYEYPVSEEDTEGAHGVTVSAVDLAGNATEVTVPGVFVLDFTPPGLARPPEAISAAATTGALIAVSLEVTEPVAEPPLVSLVDGAGDAGLALQVGEQTGLTYVLSREVGEGEDGEYELRVAALVDLAGNEAPPWTGPPRLTIDSTPPDIVDGPHLDRDPPHFRAGERVGVRFEVSEALDAADIAVTLETDPRQELLCEPAEGPEWACLVERPLDPARDPEGAAAVAIALADRAGNGSTTRAGIVLDFTRPGLLGPPRVERCDARALARVADDDLWVQAAPDCAGGRPPVVVEFRTDEPTGRDEPPAVEVAGNPLEPVRFDPGGTHFVYGYRPRGDEPQSDSRDPASAGQPVVARVADPAGNAAELVLGRLRFDFTPPAAGGEAALAGIRYLRDPWGSEESGYSPRMALEVGPEALSETGEVHVWDVTDPAGPGEDPGGLSYERLRLGSDSYVPGRALVVELDPVDRPLVHVTLVDRAGNELDADPERGGVQALAVRDVEWIATLHGKVAGDRFSNPHRAWEAVTEGPAAPAADETLYEIRDADLLAGLGRAGDGRGAGVSTARTPWSVEARLSALTPVSFPSVVYDSRRDRVVLFGGVMDDGVSGATGEWDGRGWRRRAPPTVPPARFAAAAAYDVRRGRTVLFGGFCFRDCPGDVEVQGLHADTWEWDGWDWVERHPAVRPVPRFGAGMTYDERRLVNVLFGGFTAPDEAGATHLSDTWEWDGDEWHRREPVSSPPPRCHGPLAWHPERGTVLLFGGEAEDGRSLGDLWEWDGETWTRLVAERAPPPRRSAGLAYDRERGTLVLFGGWASELGTCGDPDRGVCTDTWEWDGRTWKLRPQTASPLVSTPTLLPARLRPALVGRSVGSPADDPWISNPLEREGTVVWSWTGEDWRRSSPAATPAARVQTALVHDPQRGRSVLYGGCSNAVGWCGVEDSKACADTWEWDGEQWHEPTPDTVPVARGRHALVFDDAVGRVLLFGGAQVPHNEQGDTWSWDGSDWTREQPLLGAPARYGHALAYDPASGRTLLFGGRGPHIDGCAGRETGEFCLSTWGYAPARATPHLVLDFDAHASGLLVRDARDASEKRLRGVTVRARAGGLAHTWGSGQADGEPVPGARVAVAAPGRGGWIELLESESPPADPDDLAETYAAGWSCGAPLCDDATIHRWIGPDERLRVAVAPRAARGASAEHAEVRVDYAEVRLRWWRTGCDARPDGGAPDGTPCHDGDLATEGEACQAGACVAPGAEEGP